MSETRTVSSFGADRAYHLLLEEHGPQGWWPLVSLYSGDNRGYHPTDFSYPCSAAQQFEIAVGAILTQNSSWKQVEKAVEALHFRRWLTPDGLLAAPDVELKELIRPVGYFNQKGERLRIVARFFGQLSSHNGLFLPPTREELLALKGVGPETADSILLYAFDQPEFVVDAYSRRIWESLGWLTGNESYNRVKELFVESLERLPSQLSRVELYQEFHALLVAHAKGCHAHPSPARAKKGVLPEEWERCRLASLRRV